MKGRSSAAGLFNASPPAVLAMATLLVGAFSDKNVVCPCCLIRGQVQFVAVTIVS